MPAISTTTAPNGLAIHRISIPGTRALTTLVAFDAGARSERAGENGIAHFLEHLVFKGGERYRTYRDVNETAERMGAALNAYTSHDLVAFHITSRAESAVAAVDLLTDIAGRPQIDPDELDRERGVVIQEIARAYAAGRRVLAFENSGAVARYAANQAIVHGDELDPDVAIARIDAVTFDEVAAVASSISPELAVACVGPHAASDFD